MACRSYSKAALAAQKAGMPDDSYTIMPVDLASLQSVRDFVRNIKQSGLKPDALICNAAVWYPQDKVRQETSPDLDAGKKSWCESIRRRAKATSDDGFFPLGVRAGASQDCRGV
jgi:NAD(P)-dependent dehydrogenase (short-subunit alcohol dehydrogenase family)